MLYQLSYSRIVDCILIEYYALSSLNLKATKDGVRNKDNITYIECYLIPPHAALRYEVIDISVNITAKYMKIMPIQTKGLCQSTG